MANLGRFVARHAHLCVLATAVVGTAWGSCVELARSVDTFSFVLHELGAKG